MQEGEKVDPEIDGTPLAPDATGNPNGLNKPDEPDDMAGKQRVKLKKEALGDDTKPAAGVGSGLHTYCESSRPGEPRTGITDQPAQLSATSVPLRSDVCLLYTSDAADDTP
eukprot:3609474-Amphidinium_carterae.1